MKLTLEQKLVVNSLLASACWPALCIIFDGLAEMANDRLAEVLSVAESSATPNMNAAIWHHAQRAAFNQVAGAIRSAASK